MVTEEQAIEAMGRMIAYAWSDEYDDYCEQRGNGDIEANDENHIFTHIVRLEAWVLGTDNSSAEDLYRLNEHEEDTNGS